MRNPVPYRVKERNLKFFQITQVAYTIGLIGHASAIAGFWASGVMEMVWFNLLISVPAFSVAIVLNRLGKHKRAFSFAFFELFVHQVLGTYYMGWGFGTQFWLIYLAGLCFFNPYWKRKIQLLLLIIITGGYLAAYFLFQEGVYELSPEWLRNSYLMNAVTVIVILSLLINYFSKSTVRAEEKLREEKEITESQNKQLIDQHDSLVSERDKTHKMLNKIESLFGQQVSQEVAREMIESESGIDSKIMDVTVMFLDIRDFTVFADSRQPAEVARFQNIVFSELIDIVKEYNGIVSQILGDGIMAVFGAPVVHKGHVDNAVNAGYEMIKKIRELGERGLIPTIKIGIGLNAGKVMTGNVGNETRKFYSLTGTNVIIAARIEQLNKRFSSQFLVSDSVYEVIKDRNYEIEELGEIALKGIQHEVPVYRLA